MKRYLCLILYYGFARYLPKSTAIFIGPICKWIRYKLAKGIFAKCGRNVNVEKMAYFGSGRSIEIGDYSGIGINACIPNDTKIGNHVMMGPNCYILDHNHKVSDLETPMMFQGAEPSKQTIIGDDVWIGRDVLMTPGRTISSHSIIAGGCVLCKDFPEWSIVGGNPSRLIKNRKQ